MPSLFCPLALKQVKDQDLHMSVEQFLLLFIQSRWLDNDSEIVYVLIPPTAIN